MACVCGCGVQELFTDKELEDLVRRASSLSDLNPCLFDELKDKVGTRPTCDGLTHSGGRSGDMRGGIDTHKHMGDGSIGADTETMLSDADS